MIVFVCDILKFKVFYQLAGLIGVVFNRGMRGGVGGWNDV